MDIKSRDPNYSNSGLRLAVRRHVAGWESGKVGRAHWHGALLVGLLSLAAGPAVAADSSASVLGTTPTAVTAKYPAVMAGNLAGVSPSSTVYVVHQKLVLHREGCGSYPSPENQVCTTTHQIYDEMQSSPKCKGNWRCATVATATYVAKQHISLSPFWTWSTRATALGQLAIWAYQITEAALANCSAAGGETDCSGVISAGLCGLDGSYTCYSTALLPQSMDSMGSAYLSGQDVQLGQAELNLEADVGFGDVITGGGPWDVDAEMQDGGGANCSWCNTP